MNNLIVSPHLIKPDSLRIKRDEIRGTIKGTFTFFSFQDADTHQYVMYIPGLDISSYGETFKKAEEMMKHSAEDLFTNWLHLSFKKLEKELASLGWKHEKNRTKEYSKAFVDISGELKNFNIGSEIKADILEI